MGVDATPWVLAKGTTLPIIGPRTKEQLDDNLSALNVRLTEEQIARLDNASAIPLGFPYDIVTGSRDRLAGGKADVIDWPAAAVK